jgi:hypothetical protein
VQSKQPLQGATRVVAQADTPPLLYFPQKVTGLWNLDGTGSKEIRLELTEEVLAKELEARELVCCGGAEHARRGVRNSETVALLKSRLKDHLAPKCTEDDGELMS